MQTFPVTIELGGYLQHNVLVKSIFLLKRINTFVYKTVSPVCHA